MAQLDAWSARAEADPVGAIDALPWLADSLERDARADRFAHWGRSTVIDENVGVAVLPRGPFDELHRRAGIDARWPVGHAGVLHVYGYLLSTVPTPYGLKRARWLDGGLAEACGLGRAGLLPWRGGGTLLARATVSARRLLAESAVRTEEVDGRRAVIAIGRAAASGVSPLAYAIDGRLVTMFPVDDAAALLAGLGAPRLRWNAAH
ncbi:amino acid deaminase [Microbacterium ulmi]|uniref:Amino acid deaminase n=1 Tax=Microbacterium ulmi TaxID=179095 RepID=A0A7Y2PZS9_9MICO|nr:amino acid deaminase [Microbacterium ulmi]